MLSVVYLTNKIKNTDLDSRNMETKSNTQLLKSYFNRRTENADVMTCRLCKKDIKAQKGRLKLKVVLQYSK